MSFDIGRELSILNESEKEYIQSDENYFEGPIWKAYIQQMWRVAAHCDHEWVSVIEDRPHFQGIIDEGHVCCKICKQCSYVKS